MFRFFTLKHDATISHYLILIKQLKQTCGDVLRADIHMSAEIFVKTGDIKF